MDTAHEIEVIDKLLTMCRAGRAGRRLDLVPAFAAREARLLAERAELLALAQSAPAAPAGQPAHAEAA